MYFYFRLIPNFKSGRVKTLNEPTFDLGKNSIKKRRRRTYVLSEKKNPKNIVMSSQR